MESIILLECGYVFFPDRGLIAESPTSKVIGVPVPVQLLRELNVPDEIITTIANRMALSHRAGRRDVAETIANSFLKMALGTE